MKEKQTISFPFYSSFSLSFFRLIFPRGFNPTNPIVNGYINLFKTICYCLWNKMDRNTTTTTKHNSITYIIISSFCPVRFRCFFRWRAVYLFTFTCLSHFLAQLKAFLTRWISETVTQKLASIGVKCVDLPSATWHMHFMNEFM